MSVVVQLALERGTVAERVARRDQIGEPSEVFAYRRTRGELGEVDVQPDGRGVTEVPGGLPGCDEPTEVDGRYLPGLEQARGLLGLYWDPERAREIVEVPSGSTARTLLLFARTSATAPTVPSPPAATTSLG